MKSININNYKKHIVISSLIPAVINKLKSMCPYEPLLMRDIFYLESRNGNCFLPDILDDEWDEKRKSVYPDSYQEELEKLRKRIEFLQQRGFVVYFKEDEHIQVAYRYSLSFSFWLRGEYQDMEDNRRRIIWKFKSAKRLIKSDNIYGWYNFYSSKEDQLRYNFNTLTLELYYSNDSLEYRIKLNKVVYTIIEQMGRYGLGLMFSPENIYRYMDEIIEAEPKLLKFLEMVLSNPEAMKVQILKEVGKIENEVEKCTYIGNPRENSSNIRNLFTCVSKHLYTVACQRFKKKKNAEAPKKLLTEM